MPTADICPDGPWSRGTHPRPAGKWALAFVSRLCRTHTHTRAWRGVECVPCSDFHEHASEFSPFCHHVPHSAPPAPAATTCMCSLVVLPAVAYTLEVKPHAHNIFLSWETLPGILGNKDFHLYVFVLLPRIFGCGLELRLQCQPGR